MTETFEIDIENSDEARLFVDVLGRGTVLINITDEGIIVDIYALDVADRSAATCAATFEEIEESAL